MISNLTLTQLALIVGIVSGVLFGLIPLILGFKKQNVKLGIIGFVVTLIAGAIFSILGAIPVSGVFAWLLTKKPKQSAPNTPIEPQASGD